MKFRGQYLKETLAARGLRPEHVAVALNIGANAVYRWFNGTDPRPHHSRLLAAFLQVPERELWEFAQDSGDDSTGK